MNEDSYGDSEVHSGVDIDEMDTGLYLNEMTQDVIEWDESNNKDLDKMFKSPQPPGSGRKSSSSGNRAGRKSSSNKKRQNHGHKTTTTPSSLSQSQSQSTSNSSLLSDVRRQLDPLCKLAIESNGKKLTGRGGVNGAATTHSLPSSATLPNSFDETTPRQGNKRPARAALSRHHTYPKSKSSATSLAQRHRRRRMDYSEGQKRPNEHETNAKPNRSSTLTSGTVTVSSQPNPKTQAITNSTSTAERCEQQSIPKKPAAPDDFAELLEAMTTPNQSTGAAPLSRFPLSSVDENLPTPPITNVNSAESKDTEPSSTADRMKPPPSASTDEFVDTSSEAFPKAHTTLSKQQIPPSIIPQLRHYSQFEHQHARAKRPQTIHHNRVRVHEVIQASANHSRPAENTSSLASRGSDGKNDEDEFDEIEFSEDDLAKIDFLTQPTSLRQNNKLPEPVLSSNVKNSIKNESKTFRKENAPEAKPNESAKKTPGKTIDATIIKRESDDFGEFPSDFDFAEIDAMVSTQPAHSKLEQSTSHAKCIVKSEQPPSKAISISSKYSAPAEGRKKTQFNTHCNQNNDCNQISKQNTVTEEEEEEDEFGDFPDIDFTEMDALVATQCCNAKPGDSKTAKQSAVTTDNSNVESRKPSSPSTSDDEFGDFPDMDFNSLDQVITQRIESKSFVSVNPHGVVQNRRMRGRTSDELSFMKFSRYKVLEVEEDERNAVKTLKVAAWVTSMMNNDEEEGKIHKDGKVRRSSCHILDEEKICTFSHPTDIDYPVDGLIYLCGEWNFTPVSPGDLVHVCSLTGQFQTDVTALPIVLNSYPPPGSDIDDLILVLHPDMLLTPSIISETSSCNRRAALKNKLGSTGLSSKSAFIGTMRHGLFEACMKGAEFNSSFAERVITKLIREKAEMLIGCNVSEHEAAAEILNILPMIQQFAGQYTTLRKDVMVLSSLGKPVGGAACHPDIRLLGRGVHSVEETIVSTPLGLKGSIDAVMETESVIIGNKRSELPSTSHATGPQHSLMCFELKTGHNQNTQNVHMAQLSLYTFMLQSRYGADIQLHGNQIIGSQSERRRGVKGAAPGGILLYLNDKSQQISHVSPQLNEVKTLMSQRNVVASDSKRASRLRGIALSYDEGNREDDKEYLTVKLLPAPAADLPELKASSHTCKRCFSNRECMVYAASDPKSDIKSHRDLLSQFTGHLQEEDFAYFRKWDRLIDIEADASNAKAFSAWLVDSRTREMENGEAIAQLVFDANESYQVGSSDAIICFRRKIGRSSQSPLDKLNIAPGSHVILSTDGNIFDDFTKSTNRVRKLRNRMHVAKGFIDRVEEDKVYISTTCDELNQVTALVSQFQDYADSNANTNVVPDSLFFRLDRNKKSVGTGTLRWNLINFLSGDYTGKEDEECTEEEQSKKRRLAWLRDVVIRLKVPEFTEDPPSLFIDIDRHFPGCNLLELSREYRSLNVAQQMAVKKVMSGRDYSLIQGLPGTGKTSILGFLARLLVARGCRVLITAYTHSAVDNIMLKLMEKGMASRISNSDLSPLVRIGQKRSCHASVKSVIHSELALELDRISEDRTMDKDTPHSSCEHPSATSLKAVIASARIIGVSALSLSRSPLIAGQSFDVVIIDEAGQMNEPTALGALAAADSFVLVGDHKQLPPLVNSTIAEDGGYGVSLLKKLADKHPHAIAQLTMQYRMNEAICKISSESMYGGLMKCGDEKLKSQLLRLPGFPLHLPKPIKETSVDWLRTVVDPGRPVVFVDTDAIRTTLQMGCDRNEPKNSPTKGFESLEGKIGGKGGGSIVNRTEAALVRYVVAALRSCGHDLAEIGVVSPFRAQIRVLEESAAVMSWKKEGLELSTIDRYQGRDKRTIVLSLVRSNEKNSAGRLLQDARRLNVALTRAKHKLIVIGSHQTLGNGSAPLKPILNRMRLRNQRFQPPENALACYDID